ncbi:hypothetical protein PVAND_003563 [Polypedilum vanderplanki]|uniref:gamma-glutamylcyclotransferase n=1 Tax=Polypedilum vanderplanki TaxID=319348 RepID=A0A9J6BUF4_POLVA|nr:hypothetical protein PVAND_003563 [Polypedilum vanderplanki]
MQNKSAERVGVGKLEHFRIDFADTNANPQYYSSRWNGSPATIVEHQNSIVYGAVWKLNLADVEELDRQEGVESCIYKPISLKVYVESLEREITCRSYQLVFNPKILLDPVSREEARQPSKTYLTVIVNGAIESKLPETYVNFLKTFKHNGKYATDSDFIEKLSLKNVL